MRKNILSFLLKVRKEYIGKSPFLISIYNTLNIHKQMVIGRLQKHGIEVLKQFDDCCEEYGFKYALAFGTLLGAVREKGFIKTDDDIDLYMWIDDYTPELPKALERFGFKWKHSFIVDDQKFAREDTFSYKDVDVDIFYLYQSEEFQYPYCCDFPPHPGCSSRIESLEKYGSLISRQIFLPINKDFVKVEFLGIFVPIPKNAHEILEFRYGQSYMTPIPRWKAGAYSNDHIIVRTDKTAKFYTY